MERHAAYGVGLGYRYCIHREVMRCAAMIDYLEIPSEDYVEPARLARTDPDQAKIREAAARLPLVAHGTGLSIGTCAPPDASYLERVAAFCAAHPIGEYSEHLSFVRAGGESVDAFMALPFTDLGVAAAAENARRVQRRTGLPFLVENVSYHFAIPEATLSEAQFVARVAREADCGILLDACNLFINATNHRYDPFAYLRELPADRVLQAHYCGATREPDGYLLDTHFEPTDAPVWDLLEAALRTTALRALTFERDREFVPFRGVMEELWRARTLFRRHRPAMPVAARPRVAPTVAAQDGDDSKYSRELARFQEVVLRLLFDRELGDAVAREGETALRHTGLDRDSRRVLAALPAAKRERIGRFLRSERDKRARREAIENGAARSRST